MPSIRRWLSGAALAALPIGAPLSCALAQDGKATVIRIIIDETHDRITPEGNLAIEKLHEGKVILIGKNEVREAWDQTNVGNGSTERTHLDPSSKANSTMGGLTEESSSQVVWHVLGEHKLQRIRALRQMVQIWNIEIDSSKNCTIDAKYLLQKGFKDFVGFRAGTTELAHFTVPRVLRASCSIE